MALKLISVVNGNTPEEEYVRIQASADVNIQGYAVVDRTFDENEILSNEFRHIYVFHKLAVKKGDWIRVYSCPGKYKSSINTGKTKTHYLYWGSKTCIWNNNGLDIASLVKIELCNSVQVPKP